MRRLMILWPFLTLAACNSPAIHGNERGGLIEWFGTNEAEVFKAATAHCSRFGRSARITSINARAGGHVLFECA